VRRVCSPHTVEPWTKKPPGFECIKQSARSCKHLERAHRAAKNPPIHPIGDVRVSYGTSGGAGISKRVAISIVPFLLLLGVWPELPAQNSDSEKSGVAAGLYDANPKHLWNRLDGALLIRTDSTGAEFGTDTLDPLLWPESQHLLSGPSHQRALNVLDEFLRTHGENQIRNPLKKAMLQRSLWAVFDWTASMGGEHAAERRQLQIRLAEVIRRLALTASEVKSLPDNYAQAVASGEFAKESDSAIRERAFLPFDLLDPRGPWVCIRGDRGPVAEMHVGEISGRSRFLVFVRLPGGRQGTLDYFHALWNVPDPWSPGQIDVARGDLNPNLPQFPVGTQVALLRQMMTFDRDGALVATPITESLQIRVYRAITSRRDRNDGGVDWPAARTEQEFNEFRLSPAKLFAGRAGGLRAIERREMEFPLFQTQGNDPFEYSAKHRMPLEKFEGRILDRCAGCHSAPGINSLQSRRKLLKPNAAQADPDPPYDSMWWESENTLAWKASHYDWGLLNGLWYSSSVTR
jgi:hypothetical protein